MNLFHKMTQQSNQPHTRWEAIDAIRGIAALFVVLFHYTLRKPQAQLGFYLGVSCVDIFFLLSGFVIFFSLDRVQNWKEFLWKRFTRLYPAYWICMLITGSVLYYYFDSKSPSPFLWRFLTNMTMFQSWFNQKDLDGPYWTLIIELQFYILMALFLSLNYLKKFIDLGIFIVLGCFIYGLDNSHIYFSNFYNFLGKYIPLINHFPVTFAGVLFYFLSKDFKNTKIYIYLIITFLVQLTLFNDGGRAHMYMPFEQYILTLSCYYILMALLIVHKINFIALKPLLFLGKISYPLYLLHQYLGLWVMIPILTKTYHIHFWWACAISIFVIIIISYLINKFIEIPINQRLNKWYTQKFRQKSNN